MQKIVMKYYNMAENRFFGYKKADENENFKLWYFILHCTYTFYIVLNIIDQLALSETVMYIHMHFHFSQTIPCFVIIYFEPCMALKYLEGKFSKIWFQSLIISNKFFNFLLKISNSNLKLTTRIDIQFE